MRTIFGKQLTLYLGTLVVSFVFLGAALSQVIRGYLTNRQIDALQDSAIRVASSIEEMYSYGVPDQLRLAMQVSQMYQYLQAKIIYIDTDFYVKGVSGNLAVLNDRFYTKELDPVMTGQTVVIYGNLGGLYTEPRLTVGYPVYLDKRLISAVLISTPMAELQAAITGMYRITLLCLGISALLAFALIYWSCRAITRPLRQMNEATRVIAAGNFEKRVTVRTKDEVGQLANRFNQMAESLQEQEKIRRAFIANLSHDLRSPLTSIRGFLQAICDGTVPQEKQPYFLHIALDESERLIKLSNDMLDIHRAQEITPVLTVFDINGLIRRTLSLFEQRALEKGLRIDCRFAHEVDKIRADEDMIRRVLYNLLDNAVKFTTDGIGEIIIETTADNRILTVGVQDNGRGMNSEEQKRIFERFYKGDMSRGEDKNGSGLGLSIVKEFIRAHGGYITVESEPGKGSLFIFTMPLADDL